MSALFDLVPLLEWGGGETQSLGRLQTIHIRFIADSLATALSCAPLSDKYALLPKLSLRATDRILKSPRVCQALRVGQPILLRCALEAEIVLDLFPEQPFEGWSALGDVWLGAASPEQSAPLIIDGAGRWRGPSLSNGVPIDLSEPLLPNFPQAALESADHVGTTVDLQAVAKLEEAVVFLATCSAAASSAVEQTTANLLLRTDSRSAGVLRNASSSAAIGRTVLINVGDANVSVADIAEALVHESIHALASCAELQDPLLQADGVASPICMQSPWTGAALHPHAFLHACLVWFGIYHLWKSSVQRGLLVRHARQRMSEIRAGFSRFPDCEPILEKIARPVALDILSHMKERMLAS